MLENGGRESHTLAVRVVNRTIRGVWDARGIEAPRYRVWRLKDGMEAHHPDLATCEDCDALRPIDPPPWAEAHPEAAPTPEPRCPAHGAGHVFETNGVCACGETMTGDKLPPLHEADAELLRRVADAIGNRPGLQGLLFDIRWRLQHRNGK